MIGAGTSPSHHRASLHALTLIVMTRLPREGRNKTRLIPALGAKGAMAFHDRLARHTIGRASSFCMMGKGRKLSVCLEGGTPIEGKTWLGEDGFDCREQADGDLGERMRIASEEAFNDGAEKVIIIGTDCPGIDESTFSETEGLLEHNDLVFGPALDGGYYLIGLAKPISAVFEAIPWGGQDVLEHSLLAAGREDLKTALLGPLPDADFPEDLPAAEAELVKGSTVSVIIPTLDVESSIAETLAAVFRSSAHEVIVVDGGSTDRTVEIAKAAGAQVTPSPKGRASQMNNGAAKASGEFLLFLHADTLPPENFPDIIVGILNRPQVAGGAFRFMLRGNLGASQLIEALVGLRCRLLGTPDGDQGIFIRRSMFGHLKGFPDSPVMEDLHFIRKARKSGKIRISKEAALTSACRWEHGGLVRTCLRLIFHRIGIPQRHISRPQD
jgi:uncharacterized protein